LALHAHSGAPKSLATHTSQCRSGPRHPADRNGIEKIFTTRQTAEVGLTQTYWASSFCGNRAGDVHAVQAIKRRKGVSAMAIGRTFSTIKAGVRKRIAGGKPRPVRCRND
jgi:hypothetical protein